jgi:uncharacterized membrane protein
MSGTRREYLDWLRGLAVLIMIEAHTIDAWTQAADRERPAFGYAIILGGFGAPIFLFLAGVAIVLAAAGRVRKGMAPREAAAAGRLRGWQIFGLAFVFRVQSLVLSGGGLADLLKVDILNVMGLAMVAAATLWGLASGHRAQAVLLALAAAALAMLTPVVRATPALAWLPDPLEWYIRPYPGRTTFTMFPWAGFLLAGAAAGVWLEPARTAAAERRIMWALAVAGPALAAGAYAASFLPPIYERTSFWTSSPTFFFLRTGILLAALPVAYVVSASVRGASVPLQYFGRASLFVYWIHVEMVYGAMSAAVHRRLSLEQWAAAFVLFSVALFWIAKLKDRLAARFRSPSVALAHERRAPPPS